MIARRPRTTASLLVRAWSGATGGPRAAVARRRASSWASMSSAHEGLNLAPCCLWSREPDPGTGLAWLACCDQRGVLFDCVPVRVHRLRAEAAAFRREWVAGLRPSELVGVRRRKITDF